MNASCISWSDALSQQASAASSRKSNSVGASDSAQPPVPSSIYKTWSSVFILGNSICESGSDGLVYHAMTQRGHKPVALKFIYKTGNCETDKKLWREVDILQTFDHPNIVRLLGTFSVPREKKRYLFVEAFEEADSDLHALIQRRPDRLLSDSLSSMAACQIAAGIGRLHAESVIHRDIKPSNILVFLDSHPVRYVVADFGRARRLEAPLRKHRLIRKTAPADCWLNAVVAQSRGLGTPHFCAPELVQPEYFAGQYGCGVDVWAFGCVVFNMVTGTSFVHCDPCDRVCAMLARLGPPPFKAIDSPGPTGSDMSQVLSLESSLSHANSLVAPFLRGAFQWAPTQRLTMVHLMQNEWLKNHCDIPDPEAKFLPSAQSPGKTIQGSSLKSETMPGPRGASPRSSAASLGESSAQWSGALSPFSQVPPPPTTIITSKWLCSCSRRCRNPNHSKGGLGCRSHFLVEGSDLCEICICSLHPSCLKPRWDGPRCYGHEQVFRNLPFVWKVMHTLGKQGSKPLTNV